MNEVLRFRVLSEQHGLINCYYKGDGLSLM